MLREIAPATNISSDAEQKPASVTITFADLIIQYIQSLGIEYVFGVPGGAIEPFLDALARSERANGPKAIIARHEAGAAFMADGYYKETGKMGVVFSTTGPGATNLITGISSAYADNVPMLIITAQTPLPKFGKNALQESSCMAIDTVAMLRHCTRMSTLVSHEAQMEHKLVSAIMAAHREPSGPAHISIPCDILRSTTESNESIHADLFVHNFALADDDAINKLCEKLGRVDSIVVYIGDGVGKAAEKIVTFCELTNTPFVTGPVSKRWVNETHPLYQGVYGYAGHKSARQLFNSRAMDLIIAIGAALGELDTAGWHSELLNTKLIHIDHTAEHFTRSPMANLHVCGDINSIFERLIDNLKHAKKWGKKWINIQEKKRLKNILGSHIILDEPEKCLNNEVPIKPQRLMAYLSHYLPENCRIFIDTGNVWAWSIHYLLSSNNTGYYRVSMTFGSMAWSIGAAVGSAIANREAPTLCLVGDGAYLMSAQEITVAAEHNLPIIFLVLNDSAMGMIMHGQRLSGAESIGWQLTQVDYAAMARAMNINSLVIERPEQLDDLDLINLFCKGPTLLDVRIDREEIPPMGERIRALAAYGAKPS